MKKTYKQPELQTERFDVEDVITASDLSVVGNAMEVLLGNTRGFINSLSGRE